MGWESLFCLYWLPKPSQEGPAVGALLDLALHHSGSLSK